MSAKVTPSSFSYTITDVPDFDQQWQSLPGQGKMYCVPTATMNWLHYIAEHGWPRAVPLRSESDPALILLNLSMMANYMGTDPVGGTGGKGFFRGLTDYLDDFSVPAVVATESAQDSGTLNLQDLQAATMM